MSYQFFYLQWAGFYMITASVMKGLNHPWKHLEENLLPESCTNMVCLQLARTCTKSLYQMLVTPFELGGLKYMHVKPNPQELRLFHLYCYCVKSVRVRSFSGPYFSAFRYSADADTFHAVW